VTNPTSKLFILLWQLCSRHLCRDLRQDPPKCRRQARLFRAGGRDRDGRGHRIAEVSSDGVRGQAHLGKRRLSGSEDGAEGSATGATSALSTRRNCNTSRPCGATESLQLRQTVRLVRAEIIKAVRWLVATFGFVVVSGTAVLSAVRAQDDAWAEKVGCGAYWTLIFTGSATDALPIMMRGHGMCTNPRLAHRSC
jgi:hypothetical protein